MNQVYLEKHFSSEIAKVEELILSNITSNRIAFCSVSGEAGIGRTSFIKQLYTYLNTNLKQADIVLLGNQTPIGNFNVTELQPYKLITQIITELKNNKSISSEKKFVISAGLSLLSATPILGDAIYAAKELSKDWRYYQQEKKGTISIKDETSLDLIGALESFAKNAPLVILVDDLQWSDRPSIELLITLSSELKNYPISIIFTKKQTLQSTTQTFSDFIKFLENTDSNYLKLELNPLNQDEIRQICKSQGKFFSENQEFLDWLYKKTAGNLSYVWELLKYFNRKSPFDESGNLTIDLKQDVYLNFDNNNLLENLENVFSDDEKQLLSICSCEGRIFSAYMIAKVCETNVLNIIQKLKIIQAKSQIIQSKGMDIVYGIKSTTYEFTQAHYYNHFDSLLEYEERVSIHSLIVKELQDRLNNTQDEDIKQLLIPYIAAHSAESENSSLLGEMLDLNTKYQESLGIVPKSNTNERSLNTNTNTTSVEQVDNIAINGETNVSLTTQSLDFNSLRTNLVRSFESQLFDNVINQIEEYKGKNTLIEDEILQLDAFKIRSYTELGQFNKAKELIEQVNKNNIKNYHPIAECLFLNSAAMYYLEQKKYNKATDTLKQAAKASLKLPIELKLMTMVNIYNLLKITTPDKADIYKETVDKLKKRVKIRI